MDIKLLALDMDGTTYWWGGKIIYKNIKPIQKALDKGVEVVFVTGRPALAPINELDKHFNKSGKSLIAACNGACIYDLKENKVIESNPISADIAKKVFELSQQEKYKEVEIFGYVDDLYTTIDTRINHESESDQVRTKFFDGKILGFNQVKDDFNYKFFKLMAWNANDEFIEELRKLDLELALNKTETEINAKGINKAFAVKWLAEQNDISVDNVMAIGDGSNDLPMIEYAKYGVSMQNSNKAVKAIADIHIDTNFKDGAVGQVIEKYILN